MQRNKQIAGERIAIQKREREYDFTGSGGSKFKEKIIEKKGFEVWNDLNDKKSPND